MKALFYIALLVISGIQCWHKEKPDVPRFQVNAQIPSSIKREHDSLLGKIQVITIAFKDSAALAAAKLTDLLHHHFKEEEDYVLLPLGLLPVLAEGKLPGETEEIIRLCEYLKSQQTHLNVEHQLVKAYLDELKLAAAEDSRAALSAFEKEIQQHAKTEEEVYFPAAILVGEYLKLKSQ